MFSYVPMWFETTARQLCFILNNQKCRFNYQTRAMQQFKLTYFIFLCLLAVSNAMAQGKLKEEASVTHAAPRKGSVRSETINSTILRENLVGLNTKRNVKIYLPPGYESSGKSYPVVYYFHSIFGNAGMILGGDHATKLLERAFAKGVIGELIFVAADYSTDKVGSLYENSPVSGRWLDYTTKELVPFIDKNFRTIPHRNSRAVVGDFMGGRGALVLAMKHADIFSVAYAMHPVATGTGYLPWTELGIDWKKILEAKSAADLGNLPHDARVNIFIAICQAFLPNPSRPPFYCDFFMDLENGAVKVNIENMTKAKKGFHLEESLLESAANLKTMRGIAFDWARYDGNYDHIHSARVLSRELDDLGIEHEAEEYRGNPWNKVWTDDGRFYNRALPFIARHLVFE
jgi:enterochelin esterase-like enzyme